MIVTDRLVFLHLHKSGGTFVNALLKRCVPSARQLGYHLPYRELPAPFRKLAVVGTVRNPWAYYVSWYHFQRSQQAPNILFQICSNNGALEFKSTIENLLNLARDEQRLAMLQAGVPDNFTNVGLNITKRCVGDLRESGLGFYSFLYNRLYAGADDPKIMRMEHLRGELRSTLTALGHLPDARVEHFLNFAPPLNVTDHDEPSTYYDDGLAALVAERDREVVDRHGYTP